MREREMTGKAGKVCILTISIHMEMRERTTGKGGKGERS